MENIDLSPKETQNSAELKSRLNDLVTKLFAKPSFDSDDYFLAKLATSTVITLEDFLDHPAMMPFKEESVLLQEILSTSKAVMLSELGYRPRPEQTTLILRDIPSSASSEKVLAIFDDAVCPDGQPCPPAHSIRSDMNDTWFVSFSSEANARNALAAIRTSLFDGKPIKSRLKTLTQIPLSPAPYYRLPPSQQNEKVSPKFGSSDASTGAAQAKSSPVVTENPSSPNAVSLPQSQDLPGLPPVQLPFPMFYGYPAMMQFPPRGHALPVAPAMPVYGVMPGYGYVQPQSVVIPNVPSLGPAGEVNEAAHNLKPQADSGNEPFSGIPNWQNNQHYGVPSYWQSTVPLMAPNQVSMRNRSQSSFQTHGSTRNQSKQNRRTRSLDAHLKSNMQPKEVSGSTELTSEASSTVASEINIDITETCSNVSEKVGQSSKSPSETTEEEKLTERSEPSEPVSANNGGNRSSNRDFAERNKGYQKKRSGFQQQQQQLHRGYQPMHQYPTPVQPTSFYAAGQVPIGNVWPTQTPTLQHIPMQMHMSPFFAGVSVVPPPHGSMIIHPGVVYPSAPIPYSYYTQEQLQSLPTGLGFASDGNSASDPPIFKLCPECGKALDKPSQGSVVVCGGNGEKGCGRTFEWATLPITLKNYVIVPQSSSIPGSHSTQSFPASNIGENVPVHSGKKENMASPRNSTESGHHKRNNAVESNVNKNNSSGDVRGPKRLPVPEDEKSKKPSPRAKEGKPTQRESGSGTMSMTSKEGKKPSRGANAGPSAGEAAAARGKKATSERDPGGAAFNNKEAYFPNLSSSEQSSNQSVVSSITGYAAVCKGTSANTSPGREDVNSTDSMTNRWVVNPEHVGTLDKKESPTAVEKSSASIPNNVDSEDPDITLARAVASAWISRESLGSEERSTPCARSPVSPGKTPLPATPAPTPASLSRSSTASFTEVPVMSTGHSIVFNPTAAHSNVLPRSVVPTSEQVNIVFGQVEVEKSILVTTKADSSVDAPPSRSSENQRISSKEDSVVSSVVFTFGAFDAPVASPVVNLSNQTAAEDRDKRQGGTTAQKGKHDYEETSSTLPNAELPSASSSATKRSFLDVARASK